MTSCLLPWIKSPFKMLFSLKDFAPCGVSRFFQELTSPEKGDKTKNGPDASPESVPTHLKICIRNDSYIKVSGPDKKGNRDNLGMIFFIAQ